MKLSHLFFVLVLPIITTISCGSNDDDDDNGPERSEEKDLFSRWERSDGFFLDLRNGRFNVPFSMTFFFQSGATCQCALVLTGSQSSGEAQTSSCTYAGGGNGDPGCFQLNESATFTKDESELRLCDSGGCAVYR